MLLVDVHNMRDEETSNNIQADPQPVYDPAYTYIYGEEAVYGDYIYYSINRDNTGNQPDISPLYWVIKENINKLKPYNKYPNALAVNAGSDITLKYNVSGVDIIYLGNIHGDSVTVKAGGTYTKNIPKKSHSAIDAWGVKTYSQMTDFFVDLGSLYSGTIEVTITKSSDTNESALGFINYGNTVNVGCTLLNSIQYNIRSGGGVDWANIDLNAFRARTYTEIKLPIKIDEKTVFTKDVIDTLSEYRGLPVLIIGDDLGIREETVFFGVYTDLEAKISDKNSYDIVLRSLSYKAFVAPTEIEQSLLDSQKAVEEDENNTPNGRTEFPYDTTDTPPATLASFGVKRKFLADDRNYRDQWVLDGGTVYQFFPMIDGFSGKPTVADFGTGKYRRQVIFDTTNPCTYYYLSGGAVKACTAKVSARSGKPSSSDFAGSDFIFDTSSPCDLYYLDGGTVRKCNPTVIAYTGKPPASAFSGGAEFIRDRSSPCDIYYLDSGTVTQCSSGGGGGFGVKVVGQDALGRSIEWAKTEQGVWSTKTVNFKDWGGAKDFQFDLEGASSARIVIKADDEDTITGGVASGATVFDSNVNGGVSTLTVGQSGHTYQSATLTLYASEPIVFKI